MAYNRWINYSDELYHHGVKGMKWGRHLFGNGVTSPAGGGGGGAAETDPELAELAEKFKKGLISAAEFKAAKAKIDAKRAQEAAIKLANGLISRKRNVTEGTGVQLRDEVSSNRHGFLSRKRNVTEGTGVQLRGSATKPKKVIAQGNAVDLDARQRRSTATGRDRYRKNGMYRNMNLTDVYGKNSKVNNRVGKNGANLYKDIDVDNIHDGKDYSTRDFDKSKHNDGKYRTRDKIREKITGVADPDHLKNEYNNYVRDYDRVANQQQAYSVGLEEQDIRNRARKHTDKEEQKVRDKSLAGLVDKVTKKKGRKR